MAACTPQKASKERTSARRKVRFITVADVGLTLQYKVYLLAIVTSKPLNCAQGYCYQPKFKPGF